MPTGLSRSPVQDGPACRPHPRPQRGRRREQGQKLVFWGDITHGDVVQFEEPDVTIGFDEDPAAAASARDAAFAEAVKEGYLIAGAHTRFPGIGHVGPDSDKFDWVPLNYRATL